MIKLQLEAFDSVADPPDPEVAVLGAPAEDIRLAAFEQGYSAGWDDAVAAQTEEIARLRADLGRNLQEMSFTFHEARAHLLRGLEPLLSDMVTKVLPAVAHEALGAVILEALMPAAGEMAEAPVRVLVGPGGRAVVAPLLQGPTAPPLEILEEPSLGPGQAYLQLGHSEKQVDLDGVIAGIAAAVGNYFRVGEGRTADD